MSGLRVLEFTADGFESEVLGSPEPVLVDVWAQGCMPCKMLSPIIEKLAQTYEGQLKVGKLDATHNQDVAIRYEISAVPTVLLIKDGELVSTLKGLQPEHAYIAEIEKVLA